jgi:hypothetical protein
MPTSERRFYLGLLVQQKQKEQEQYENSKKQSSNSKGTKKTNISGDVLKNKIKSGEIPMK